MGRYVSREVDFHAHQLTLCRQLGRLSGPVSFAIWSALLAVLVAATSVSWALHFKGIQYWQEDAVWRGPDNRYVAPDQFFTLERWNCGLKVHVMYASNSVTKQAITSQCEQAKVARKMILPVLALTVVTFALHIWAWRGLKLSVSRKSPPSYDSTMAQHRKLSVDSPSRSTSDGEDVEKDLPNELASPTDMRSPVSPIGTVAEADAHSVQEADASSVKELEGSLTPKELEAGHLPAEKDGHQKL